MRAIVGLEQNVIGAQYAQKLMVNVITYFSAKERMRGSTTSVEGWGGLT